MSERDLVYVGHMLDMARKAVAKVGDLPRETYDADENLRLALIQTPLADVPDFERSTVSGISTTLRRPFRRRTIYSRGSSAQTS